MALVQAGYLLTVTLLDNGGNDTSVQYQLRGTTASAVASNAAAIISALSTVSGGVIASYRITQTFVEDALSLPTASVQAEVSASMTTLINDAGNKKASYRIPMPLQSIFVSSIGTGANIVNTANSNVLAYHALFAPTGDAYVSDREDAGGLLSGVRVTRARRGG